MTASQSFLPYGRQTIEDYDVAAVCEVMRGDWLTTGPTVSRFEEAFAEMVGAKCAVACNSGTAALHLATASLDLQVGDIAIVPAVTFLATANAVRFTGAEVRFADVDPDTGLITVETVLRALESGGADKIKALLPVHLGGAVVDVGALAAAVSGMDIAIVEDACHALGATDGAFKVGMCPHSQSAAFSLHPVKTITAGEGGMLTFNDAKRAARAKRLRSHGMEPASVGWVDPAAGMEGDTPAPWYYEMAEIGFNYRLTDVACAIGLSQLNKLDRFLARRAELASRYDMLLAPLAPDVLPPVRMASGRAGWHLYAVRIDFDGLNVKRGEVMRRLRAVGVGTQVHYIPVHRQPYYRARYPKLMLPGADAYYDRTLSLPFFPTMLDEDVDRVVAALATALGLGS